MFKSEQLSLVLRFVDKDSEIREEFLGFLHCELGFTGKALAETILTEIGNLALCRDVTNSWLDDKLPLAGYGYF